MTRPLTPGAYLKARRSAVMLSIDDVAELIDTDPHVSARERAQQLALIEGDTQPVSFATLVALRQIYWFDMSVIATLEAIRQGWPITNPPALCRICADGGWRPLPHREQQLCFACHQAEPPEQLAAWLATDRARAA